MPVNPAPEPRPSSKYPLYPSTVGVIDRARERAREQHRLHVPARHVDALGAAGLGVLPDPAHLAPRARAAEPGVEREGQGDRERERDARRAPGERPGRALELGERGAGRDVGRAQRGRAEERDEREGRSTSTMRFIMMVLMISWTPRRARISAGISATSRAAIIGDRDADGQRHVHGVPAGARGHPAGGEAAERELPFGADVEEPGAEPDLEGEAREDERRGLEEDLADAVRRAPGARERPRPAWRGARRRRRTR